MPDGLDAILHRQPPTSFELLLQDPVLFLASVLYRSIHCKESSNRSHMSPASEPTLVRIICMSDTHNIMLDGARVPSGDILIHAGDLTQSGSPAEIQRTLDWIQDLPHPHKIVIAGNHDRCLAEPLQLDEISLPKDVVYLQDTACRITVRSRTLKIFGSPWTPAHGSGVFQYPRSAPNIEPWSSMPSDVDILITHGPPAFHLDLDRLGCTALLEAMWKIRPKVHVFGHIHAGRGVEVAYWDTTQRLYESIMRRKSGWWGLVQMALACLRDFVAMKAGKYSSKGKTILVNASVCGGMRDEEIRDAIVIDLL